MRNSLLLLSVIAATAAHAQLNGVYTVNPGMGGNYATIGGAISALQTQGVSGPVTINIASGVYPEALVINPIAGSSATNTITFRSATGSAAAVTIAPTTADVNHGLAAVFLNGADHIRFDQLTVDAFQNGISYGGHVVGLAITRCVFEGVPNGATIGVSNAFNGVPDQLRVEECTFNACLHAMSIRGTSGTYGQDIILKDNTISSSRQHARGISCLWLTDALLEGNTIDTQAPLSGVPYYSSGISLANCAGALKVAKNRIVHGTGASGIDASYVTSTGAEPLIIENNMVRITGGYPGTVGISFGTVDHLVLRHNTVRCDVDFPAVGITGYTMQATVSANILSTTNTGPLMIVTAPTTMTSGGNVYDGSGSTTIQYNTSPFGQFSMLSFGQWAAMGYDPNTAVADPQFLSATDLHIASTSPAVGLAPFPATVATDIDGDPRPGTASDLVEAGADEINDCVPMSGTYTIGPGQSADFPSLNTAKNALYLCGISGPVVFSIAPGTYTEYLAFNTEVQGASATNTIKWRGQSTSNTSVVWQPPVGVVPLLSIAAVDHMIFENFTMARTNNNGFTLVKVLNAGAPVCQGLAFLNMRFVGNGMQSASNYLIQGTGPDAVASTTFEACEFKDGAIAIKWSGAAGEKMTISECTVTGCRQQGFDLSGMGNGLGVVKNSIRSNSSGLVTAIGLTACNGSFRVSDNTIDITGSGTGSPIGIGLGNCVCTSSKRGGVMNNTIISWQRNRSIGIRMVGTTAYVDVWNNSISLQNSNHTGSPLEIASGFTGANNRVNNNILSAQASYAVYNFNGAAIGTLRNNVLYTTQADLAYWNGARADMPALQAVSSQFPGSLEADPLFVSSSNDLHIEPTSPAVAAAHAPTSTSYDFDAQSRPRPAGTNPDIGADEVDQSNPFAARSMMADVEVETSGFTLYPNPGTDRVRWGGLPSGAERIQLFDTTGRRIRDMAATDPDMNVIDLPAGAYQTMVTGSGSVLTSVRLIVIH